MSAPGEGPRSAGIDGSTHACTPPTGRDAWRSRNAMEAAA